MTISVNKFTPKQQSFINYVVQGMSYTDAYINSYNITTSNKQTIYQNAWLLANSPKVANEIKRLNTEISQSLIKSKLIDETERKEVLARIIRTPLRDEDIFPHHVISAAKVYNDMEGLGTPTVNINVDKAMIDARDKLTALLSVNKDVPQLSAPEQTEPEKP